VENFYKGDKMKKLLLNATNISHSFDYELFNQTNFTLESSSSISIVGRSGCGKSTLLHILSSFLKPLEGSVNLLEYKNIYSLKDEKIEEIRRYDIGIIFQFHYLFKGMSGAENIEIASMLSNEKIDDNLLELLEIKDIINQKVSELSGGQQQRVSIARVLSKKPKIIFADEPTGNLDKDTANLVMSVLLNYIKEHNAGLILVTHDENMASMCDISYRLEDKILSQIKI
jgi:putative ABC transport system ATP-binding protein